jgi:hypothetical protein
MFIAGRRREGVRELSAGRDDDREPADAEVMARIGFDEGGAREKSSGIRYVHIPMRGSPENPHGAERAGRLCGRDVVGDGNECASLHESRLGYEAICGGVLGFGSGLVPVTEALKQTRQINLMDDHAQGHSQTPATRRFSAAHPGDGGIRLDGRPHLHHHTTTGRRASRCGMQEL